MNTLTFSNKLQYTKKSQCIQSMCPLNKRFCSSKLWQEYVLDKYYRYFGLNNTTYLLIQNGKFNNKSENGINNGIINCTALTSCNHQIELNPLNKRFGMTKQWSEYVLKNYYKYFTGYQQCLS